jgi:FMN phosphatase YigB (HAD superfamily)
MKKIVLFDIDHTLFDTPQFKQSNLTNYVHYDEVVDVINSLKDITTVGIYSEGDHILQTKKLTETKLLEHFHKSHLYIFDKKLDHIEEIFTKESDTQFYLIDDRPLVLSKVKNYNSDVQTIWIRRGIYQDEVIEGFTPDHTVTNLRDILNFITKDAE